MKNILLKNDFPSKTSHIISVFDRIGLLNSEYEGDDAQC